MTVRTDVVATDVKVPIQDLKPGDVLRWFDGFRDTVTVVEVAEEQAYHTYRLITDDGHDARHQPHDKELYVVRSTS